MIINKKILNNFKIRCAGYRKRILNLSQNVSALHIGGAFSCIEIVDYIYNFLLRKNEKFIMSKGHSCITQYAVLEKKKVLQKKYLDNYCMKNGTLGVHPDLGSPGIEASTGSLGHGLNLAVGIAHANKIMKNKLKTYVLISDGELQEGSTWEALMMAANLNLNNLVCFLDHNGSQSFGHTMITHPKFYPIDKKIISFNWKCEETNGHDLISIDRKMKCNDKKKPFFLICNTIKGKDISFMENEPIWHYRSPNIQEFNIAINEINEKIKIYER